MKTYLICLTGQGDINLALINEDLWNWISNQSANAPDFLIDRLLKEQNEYIEGMNQHNHHKQDLYTRETILNTEGPNSWDNDRAANITAISSTDQTDPRIVTFSSLVDLANYLKNHPNINVEDEYRGYIY